MGIVTGLPPISLQPSPNFTPPVSERLVPSVTPTAPVPPAAAVDTATEDPSNPSTPATNGEQLEQTAARQSAEQQQEALVQAQEQQELTRLRARDREVRAHEQAHAAAGGQFACAPQFQFARGPDGKRYAVAGEVSIRLPGGSTDPQTLIAQLQTVRRAALAPANPSPQDLQVAASAQRGVAQARGQLREIAAAERNAAAAEARARQDAQAASTRRNRQEVLVAEPVNLSSRAAVSASGVPVTKVLKAFKKAEALTLDQPVLELNRNGRIIAAVGESARRGDILNIAL